MFDEDNSVTSCGSELQRRSRRKKLNFKLKQAMKAQKGIKGKGKCLVV